ncbi:hypothetical protein ACQI5H_23120 [Mycobacterium heidelbergense]|uniref:hypothetical protein n=1 Tax=Mycobacterium heidelbergense TaxID=53376 RepID=UPI003CEF5218
MRFVIGAFLIALMGCVFTLLTAVIFVTQHLFASIVIAGLLASAAGLRAHRRKPRRAQRGVDYPTAVTGPQLPPSIRWPAHNMSSAPLRRSILSPGSRKALP